LKLAYGAKEYLAKNLEDQRPEHVKGQYCSICRMAIYSSRSDQRTNPEEDDTRFNQACARMSTKVLSKEIAEQRGTVNVMISTWQWSFAVPERR